MNSKKSFNAEEVSMFCEQIAMLLNGGISVYEGINMLYTEMEDTRTKEVLQQVEKALKKNLPLHEALETTDSFPSYMIHMVKIGESTGKLEAVMRSLSLYYERERAMASSVKSAVGYPMVLFFMMAGILLVLVWKILPMFEQIFQELNSDVAAATENVLRFGKTTGQVIAIVTCVLMLAIAFLYIWCRTKNGKRVLMNLLENQKGFRALSGKIAMSKFVSSMSLMLSSGMNISEALELAAGTTSHRDLKRKINDCKKLYEKSVPFDEALSKTKLIVGMEGRMVSVAAKSGAIDTVFNKLGEQHNDAVTEALGRLSSVIETILVVALSLFVGVVLLSVMVPLVNMISSIG